jgi:hypothetical protein
VSSDAVVCKEHLTGLLPLEPDDAVIAQIARAEYPGPASQRIEVAHVFASDPIGIMRLDPRGPAGAPSPTGERGGSQGRSP